MRKFLVMSSTLLIFTVASPTTFADEGNINYRTSSVYITKSDEVIGDYETVYELTLDKAINYGLYSNYSLKTLKYNIESIKSQIEGLKLRYDELKDDLFDLERNLSRLESELNELEDEYAALEELINSGNEEIDPEEIIKIQMEIGEIKRAIKQLENGIEEMEKALREMEDGIEGLKYSERMTKLTNEQAEKAIPFQITAEFIQLAMQDEQIQLQKESLKTQEQHVANMKRRYELGVISKNEYEREKREVARLQSQIEQAERTLQNNVALFSLDIGLTYNEHITLQVPNIENIDLITQTKTTNSLIENSYSMKIAKEKLELEKYHRDRVYDDSDANEHDENQADIAVKLAELEIAELRRDSEKAIKDVYTNVLNKYEDIYVAERELDYAIEDIENMKKRYEAGIISEQDYLLSKIQIEQEKLMLQLEKYQYYLLKKQVELLESGVIITE